MGRTVEIPGVSGVAENATFTIECPVGGRTYEKIGLELGNIANDEIVNLTVEINGKAIQTYADLAELKLINDYYGRDDDTGNGFHWLYFVRPELLENARKLNGIGTLDVSTLTLRGDITATVSANAPTVKAHAELGDVNSELGLITKVKAFPVSFVNSGTGEIDKLPRGPRIMAMHLIKADVNDVEVEADGVKIYDASKGLAESLQKHEARVPQSGSATHVDFMLDGDIGGALVTASLADFRTRMDLGSAGTVRAVVEYLDQFAGI